MEGAALPVFEINADQTSSAFQAGSHFLYDDSATPLLMLEMQNLVAETEEESFLAWHVSHPRFLRRQF